MDAFFPKSILPREVMTIDKKYIFLNKFLILKIETESFIKTKTLNKTLSLKGDNFPFT